MADQPTEDIAAANRAIRVRKLKQYGHVFEGTSTAPWVDDSGNAWELEFEWAALKGGLVECVGLTVRSAAGPDTRAISSSVLRQVKNPLIATARRERARKWRAIGLAPNLEARAKRARARYGDRGGQQGQPLTDEDLQEVAELYRAALEEGSRAPTMAVRDGRGVSLGTARKQVRQARDAGYLGEAIPGKPGEIRRKGGG